MVVCAVTPPVEGRDWIAVGPEPLPVGEVMAWTSTPGCGAMVAFCGTVRDHSPGHARVSSLEYEAYERYVEPRIRDVVSELRVKWPDIDRVALLHRTGQLEVGEVSVVVLVSAPHRAEAFEAARFGIDRLKATAPIWKREHGVADPTGAGLGTWS